MLSSVTEFFQLIFHKEKRQQKGVNEQNNENASAIQTGAKATAKHYLRYNLRCVLYTPSDAAIVGKH